jgi:hypothetical protein
VPSPFRPVVWPALIKNIHAITPRFYLSLITKAATCISAESSSVIPERTKTILHLNKIEQDIERTFP